MDPGVPALGVTDMATPCVGPLVSRTPFEFLPEHASASLVGQTLLRPRLWDVAVGRFTSPARKDNRQQLTQRVDSAQTAYARAFVVIQKCLKDVDATADLKASSQRDVEQTALELLDSAALEDRGLVSSFLDVLHHYHGVFDVLSQAGEFCYLAVVWGGIKTLLIMAKNKKELLVKVTDRLVDIGMALSRIEVYAKLYPTARMVSLISMTYAAVADFLEQVVRHFSRKSGFRMLLSSLVRPFDEKFGRAMERIHQLETCVEKDAKLLHALQTASIAQHQLDAFLHRTHMHSALAAATPNPHPLQPGPHPPLPDVFLRVKETLFGRFPDQAAYHESLAATYSVTARAWEEWFAVEQAHLPSAASPASGTRLSQGLCDAPDHQHALQWAAQQRALSPHLPSAYLIWAQGMTVHTAVASLVFQILQQRPAAAAERGLLDPAALARGAVHGGVAALWDVFTHLMRAVGGCLVYVSIGSAGEDEFALVERFVRTVRAWDGPPIWVTIIHPYNERFEGIATATDLDGLYDVHPSLTTTDALHHVLMLELDVHQVDDTIQRVLWEAVWRETRYASIGISFTRVVDMVQAVAEALARAEVDGEPVLPGDEARAWWAGGVRRWIAHPVASNSVRELMQRHLDIIDLALPRENWAAIREHLQGLVGGIERSRAGAFASRSMTKTQRYRVWDEMKAAIIPASEAMFCTAIRGLLADALDTYREVPCLNARQADAAVIKILNHAFLASGEWKNSLSGDAQLMASGITEAIKTGFAGTIVALQEPEDAEGSE